MKCPKCQLDNPGGAKFCNECGCRLALVCPNCDKANQPGSKFCNECGHNLQAPSKALDYSEPQSYTPKFLADKILTDRSAIEGERKLVTVLFADVADYTSLSEKLDPEEVHQIMDGCFKILMDEIHKYEGTINQFTGDGVMALFGAPVAHEDHAQRACQAALSIQSALETYHEQTMNAYGINFRMRIGLNSGPVIVGAIGDDLRMDYTAVGDTTNLAARMQTHAEQGAVLASANTYKIAKDFFEFKPLGQIPVKGKELPQEAFTLVAKSDVKTRIDASSAKGLTKFVGRKNSLSALMEAYQTVKFGAGQVVGVVGEAGVGKSRLVWEFKNHQLTPEEFTFLEGQCIHYGSAMPYLPIIDILKTYFDIEEDEREFVIRHKIKHKIHGLDETLKSAIIPFYDLFSLQVDDAAYLQVDPSVRKMRIFESLMNLFVRESQDKPLIIVIEDLHWIDKISEEFINYFIEWIYNARILLVLLYRPEYTHQWGNKSHYARIGLTHLGTDSSSSLVQAILGDAEIDAEIKNLILQRAGGNPLFVEELTHNLLENGAIEKKDNQYVLTRKASEIEVPETLQGIIASRIDRVEESLKRVMQIASVIGREFAFRVLASIMGMREELKSSLLNLQGLDFISEKQLFPELEYIFKHALTQEVAYNSLLQKRKKEIHEKVAGAIEDLYPERLEEYYELLAYHYKRSDNKTKALEYLDKANQKAIRLNAMQEAMAYFHEVMDLLDTLEKTAENQKRRISIISNQIWVFFILLKASEYYDLLNQYEPVAANLNDAGLNAKFYSALSQCEYSFGYFDQSIETASAAIEFAKATGNMEYAYWAHIFKLWSHVWIGEFEKVHDLRNEIKRLLETSFNLQLYIHAFGTGSMAYNEMGQFQNAIKAGNEALKIAKKYSDNGLTIQTLMFIAWANLLSGDANKAFEYAKTGLDLAQNPRDKILAQAGVAWSLCHTGEPQKGIEILLNIIPMLKAARYQSFLITSYYFLAEGYWLARDYNNASDTLQILLNLAESHKMQNRIGFAHYLLGEIALEKDPAQTPDHFKKAIDIFKTIKSEYYLARAYSGFGRFHKNQGDSAQAREYLTQALEIFERLEIVDQPAAVKKELAELPA